MERGSKRTFNESTSKTHIRFDNDSDGDKTNEPTRSKGKRTFNESTSKTHIRFDNDSDDDKTNEPTRSKGNDTNLPKKSNADVSELDKMNPVTIKTNLRKVKQHQKFRHTKPRNTKRGRIIIRNLPFKTTEENLKLHFDKFGPISEVKLLKRPDGKLVGCGFIQFDVVQHAAKALLNLSGKPFLGREIVCDWALGKSTYVKNMQEALKKEIKEENDDPIEVKDDPDKENNLDTSVVKEEIDVKVKEENDDSKVSNDDDELEIIESDIKQDNNSNDSDNSDEDDSNSDEDESDADDENESEENENDTKDQEPEAKRPRVISNDIEEGKTVFIKNVPFSATNEDIKECMQQFGPVYYALVCMDKLTEYSKGTAFVKFRNLEDAEKCLAAGTELTLKGNILDCHKAMSKTDLDKKNVKPEVKKDTRHLYLIKEGVILAGTKAAKGVSASDMAKRLELERWKTQILRNLNMFISLYRLIIHNLPPTYDDKQLRALFAKYAGSKAVIREAKVMLDLKNMGPDGKPISKEYGFVAFAKHEDALKALRAINNNPSIFTYAKRPIVAFSIENKSVINAKTKRLAKSKINNPKSKDYDPKAVQLDKESKNYSAGKDVPVKEYSGVAAKPGVHKLRSRHKLSTQAQLHHENLKQEKRRMKLTRKSIKKKKMDYLKQAKQRKGKKKQNDSDNLTKMVHQYSKTANKFNKSVKKQKWYAS